MTAGLLNGFWPGSYTSCKTPHPYSGLPQELVANCTASQNGKKPAFCEQKYVGRISMATDELQAALNSYGRIHSNAIEEARQEVVEFYEVRTKELNATIQAQKQLIIALNESVGKLEEQLASKKLELKDLNAEHSKAKSAGSAAVKAAEEQKAKVAKLEKQLALTSQQLLDASEKLANRTAAVQAMESERAALKSAISKKEADISKLEKDAEKLSAASIKSEAAAAETKKLLEDSKKAIDVLKRGKVKMDAELKKANETHAKDLEAIKLLRVNVQDMNKKLATQTGSLSELKAESDAKAKLADSLDKRVGELNATVANLESERDTAAKGLKAKVEEAKKLEARVVELERKLKQQQDAWQADQGKWEEERNDMLGKLERARTLFDRFVEHNSKVQALLVNLQAYFKSGVAQMIQHSDDMVKESKTDRSLEKIVNDIRSQLTI
eukprot:CAMPEP_0117657470 /NCGR_PEP_ID=MMETSP0804-20121206/5349_1 /TAXON_ID=1074897 /ORGANISM="Tetraselmis astigmatica, Strain CCMP880" /LENGTH=440 /DNA_ID=CAMNT_0005463929 /DNA_START=1029 /DNA_END=2351 /DNA_ORIENTATION=-